MNILSERIMKVLKEHRMLAAILGIGFLLRLSGIFWGIPLLDPFEGDYHPDEWVIITGAVGFPGHILTNLYLVYPTFFSYFLGIITLPLRVFFDSFGLPEPGIMGSNFYYVVNLIGRLCSVLAGTGTIFLTYLLAKDVYDKKRAVVASAFLALTLYHVSNSSFSTTDVLTSFFLVLFLIVLRRSFLTPERTSLFVYSGIILGLLMGTKYTGALAGLAIVVMYGYAIMTQRHNPNESGSFNQRKLHWNLLLCGMASVVTFFLTTPGILLHFNAFMDSMLETVGALGRFALPRSDWGTWVVVFEKFVVAVGLPLASVFLFGLLFSYKKNVYEMSYIVILVVFFGYFGATLFERYVILIAPLVAIVASNGACWVYESPKKPVHVLGFSMIAIVLVYSLGYCVTGVYFRLHDTRTEAGHYVHDIFPKGTTLGRAYTSEKYGWTKHAWMYPKVDLTRFRSMDFLDYPEVVIVSSAFPEKHIEEALQSDKLSAEFVWDKRYTKEWWDFSPPSPRVFRFYDDLSDPVRSKYTLLKTFKKRNLVPLEFGPPEIKIFIRKSNGPNLMRSAHYPSQTRFRAREEQLTLPSVKRRILGSVSDYIKRWHALQGGKTTFLQSTEVAVS